MAGMGFMIAAASRNRDDKGRYMDDRNDRRMGNDHSTRMDDNPEMRRRRDDRGRYMDGGAEMAYRPWPDPHTPPHLEDGQNPYGDEPEVYRRQREGKQAMTGGEITYKRPDGASGRVAYYKADHKTDPMDQHDGMQHMTNHRQIGFQQEDDEGLDKETVMGWVEDMEDSDGVRGGKYTWHQAQQYALNKGISGQKRLVEFYWAMNAMYSDYHEAAKKFGVDKPEFYACLAKLFLEDPDAVEDKVKAYHDHVSKK